MVPESTFPGARRVASNFAPPAPGSHPPLKQPYHLTQRQVVVQFGVPQSNSDVLADIKGYASAGRVMLSRHARVRMGQRSATMADVIHVLTHASSCVADGSKWKVIGSDLDGCDLVCVVAIENGLVVVTVF